jgi:hypothetical protein
MRVVSAFAIACALVVSASAQYPGSTPPPANRKAGFESISIADAKEWLGYLAGPETEGRGSGQPGYQIAAEYVAAKLKGWGIKPMGTEGSYFQTMPFTRTRVEPESVAVTLNGKSVALGNDLAVSGGAGEIKIEAPLVVVRSSGAALADPAIVKDAIVVLVGQRTQDLNRQLIANRPRLTLGISTKVSPGEWSVSAARPGAAPRSFTRASITEAGLQKLLEAAGAAMPNSGASTTATKVGDFSLTAMGKSETVQVPNVVGLIEGSDPVLKGEYIGIGAHLDHEGIRGGVVYPGADDDGSGSTALLQVAKAFVTNPVKPKRSILFMWFAAEEMGLIGSRFYSDNPTIPIHKMIAELQMDMVGRNSDGVQNGDRNRVDKAEENIDTMRLVGSKRISQDLDDLIQSLNTHTKFKFKYDAEDVYTRSDHYNFARLGIPIAFFFDGFHPDYHQPTDTVDKINFEKLTTTAKLCYLVAAELADRSEPLKKNGSG